MFSLQQGPTFLILRRNKLLRVNNSFSLYPNRLGLSHGSRILNPNTGLRYLCPEQPFLWGRINKNTHLLECR